MLSPYAFVQHVKHMKFELGRSTLAALALNLHYGQSAMPFDISRLVKIIPEDRARGAAAIAWIFSHSGWRGETEFPAVDAHFLTAYVREWFEFVAAGNSPGDVGP